MNQNQPSRDDLAALRRSNLSRRRFLRGVGACVALPAMQSLLPSGALAALAESAAGAGAAGPLAASASGAPLRMAFVYFPNGAHQMNWWPTGEGKEFQLSKTLQPLEAVKNRILAMSAGRTES